MSRYLCARCGTELSPFAKECPKCGLENPIRGTHVSTSDFTDNSDEAKKAEAIGQAAALMGVAAVLLIGIPLLFKLLVWLCKMLWKLLKLVGKLFGWIFSMLALPVTIIAKKPKVVL